MIDADLPLLDLFLALRGADFQLGITEYRDLLRALQHGFGTTNDKELRLVCQALWVKTDDERRHFDAYFERMLKEHQRATAGHQQQLPLEPAETATPQTPLPGTSNQPTLESIPTAPPPSDSFSAQGRAITPDRETVEPETLRAELMKTLVPARPITRIPRRFILTTDYYPVSSREMKQNWRYLRRMVREGPKVELDVDETVKKFGREGILLEPVLVSRRLNRVELLLAVDRGGSMVPFHLLGRELADTAQRGGRQARAGISFFHNVPVDHLYSDPAMVEGKKIDTLLANLHTDRTVVLIFSDAGAARGGYNADRIQRTQVFLDQLRGAVRRTVWLNPMPRARWEGTSAADIARLVPMFEFTRRGMLNAIDLLRGSYAAIPEGRV